MPAIDVAMARSLRGGLLDRLAASLAPVLRSRDVISDVGGDIDNVKTAFSSWSNCMAASYCKWPVIVLIIIGGLILLSVVSCIGRCLCCGLPCCCECFRCFKCCGNCCGCCDPPGGRKHKYLDDPFIPPHHDEQNAYRSPDPMNATPAFPTAFATASMSPQIHQSPQYAEFDSTRKGAGNEDALPEMPSWDGANSKKVLVEEEEVELEQLKKPELSRAGSTNGQNVPLMTGAAVTPGPASPIPSPDHNNPYGPPGAHAAPTAYSDMPGPNPDPYAHDGQGNNYNGAYDQRSSPPAMDQTYGMSAAAVATGRNTSRSPNAVGGYGGDGAYIGTYPQQGKYDAGSLQNPYDDYSQHTNQGYGMGPDRRTPAPRNPNMYNGAYGAARQSPGPRGDYGAARQSPAPRGDYGPPRQSPAPRGEYGASRRSPAPRPADYGSAAGQLPSPQAGGYGYSENHGNSAYQPHESALQARQPQRQYSHDMPSSSTALPNSGGFDFSSDYSRPSSLSQQHQQQQATPLAGYPGYRAYQPTQ